VWCDHHVKGNDRRQPAAISDHPVVAVSEEMEINDTAVSRWQRFERAFTSQAAYDNPLQDVRVTVTFRSPSGEEITLPGFWDGGSTWRVRFAPGETGTWHYTTICSNHNDSGLDGQAGAFECQPPSGPTQFNQHGRVQLSENRRHLVHADGTPFFWLADTCWNGPLRSTDSEWETYLTTRAGQKFTAVQWVATQWIAAPDGDVLGQCAFEGHEKIQINPTFFQRLDHKLDAINRAGLLGVPVLLWAANWGKSSVMNVNPGLSLPVEQATLLAEYMVARWDAYDVVWILPGDGDYRGEKAQRWKQIGRSVFGSRPHAPVSLHPAGQQWNLNEFIEESWLDISRIPKQPFEQQGNTVMAGQWSAGHGLEARSTEAVYQSGTKL
jgi:hypothetical protein